MGLIERLRRIGLLAGLSGSELEAVFALGELRSLQAQTVFIEQGDSSTSLYLVLSGRVKVYEVDPLGKERVLQILQPGAHLGELALLRDAVRTASAVTLEDSELLVLSRRAFMECLAVFPRIAMNLDQGMERQTGLLQEGLEVTDEFRAWSKFRHSGLPLVVLIGGCSGTGKSTVAAELALRLDIGRILSTDILREVVRLFVSRQSAPEIHVSSFEAWRVLSADTDVPANNTSRLINGFRSQCDKLAVTIDEVIKRAVKEGMSTLIEGIHLRPGYRCNVDTGKVILVSVLLTNPSCEELEQHFYRRGQLAPSRGAVRYLEQIDDIWRMQEHLVEEAARCRVPVLPNSELETTIQAVIGVITEHLKVRFL